MERYSDVKLLVKIQDIISAKHSLSMAEYHIRKYNHSKELESKQLAAGYVCLTVKYMLHGVLSNYQVVENVGDYNLNEYLVMLHGKGLRLPKLIRDITPTIDSWQTPSSIPSSVSISSISSIFKKVNNWVNEYNIKS